MMECSICRSPEAEHFDERPTGEENAMQVLAICGQCWQTIRDQAANKDIELAARYRVFVEWLCGRRGLLWH
jgi:hypothetical protein